MEGLISDTITQAQSDNEEKCNEETDVSLSLLEDTKEDVANEDRGLSSAASDMGCKNPTLTNLNSAVKSPSSHVETDSLDESEHAGQHS